MLTNSFPELNLGISSKARVPLGHWRNTSQQRTFFEAAATKLGIVVWLVTTAGIKEPKDWYYVSTKQIYMCGGRGVLAHYNGSLIQALQALYPEWTWNAWRFSSRSPHGVAQHKSHFSKTQHMLFRYVQAVSCFWTLHSYL